MDRTNQAITRDRVIRGDRNGSISSNNVIGIRGEAVGATTAVSAGSASTASHLRPVGPNLGHTTAATATHAHTATAATTTAPHTTRPSASLTSSHRCLNKGKIWVVEEFTGARSKIAVIVAQVINLTTADREVPIILRIERNNRAVERKATTPLPVSS